MTAKDLGLISIAHKDLVERAFKNFPPEISEHTFSNLFIWRDMRPIHVVSIADALVFVEDMQDHVEIFGPPVGDINLIEAKAELEQLFKKRVYTFIRIPKSNLAMCPAGFSKVEDRNNFDYVYSRDGLAELSGNKFHDKKNLVNQCLQNYDCTYEALNRDNLHLISKFQERWCEQRKCSEAYSLCQEFRAINEVIERYDTKTIIGGMIKIKGEVQAYTMAERLNNDTAVIHFEKAESSFKGLYQLINYWFARNSLSQFQFINREQDLGIDGLRKAKQSYNPVRFVEKFNFTSPEFKPRTNEKTEKKCI